MTSAEPYTPANHEIRARAIAGAADTIARRDAVDAAAAEEIAAAEFDRWLAAHDAAVRQEERRIQHAWHPETGGPFCGDEEAMPLLPQTHEETMIPLCALCHKLSMKFGRAEERRKAAQIAEKQKPGSRTDYEFQRGFYAGVNVAAFRIWAQGKGD